jgi:hypothetical protein
MELIDNLTVVIWPGALEAGVGDPVPYIAVAAGFAIAYPFAFLANRYLIARGKGSRRGARAPRALSSVMRTPGSRWLTVRGRAHAL